MKMHLSSCRRLAAVIAAAGLIGLGSATQGLAAGTVAAPDPGGVSAESAVVIPVVPAAATGGSAPLLVSRGPGHPARFTAYGRRLRVDFDAEGLTLTQFGPSDPGASHRGPRGDGLRFRRGTEGAALGDFIAPEPAPRAVQRWRFAGAGRVAPQATGWLPTRFHRLRGPSSGWELDRPCASGLVYPDLWPGVNLVVRAEAGGLALRLEAESRADLAQARIAIDGGQSVVAAGGDIGLTLPWGQVAGWQGLRLGQGSSADDALAEGATLSADAARLRQGSDAALALGFVYAGQWGMPGGERGLGVAVDGAGAAYLTGETTDDGDDIDAYVAKISPDGSTLAYLTIVGGEGYDAGYDIDVTPSGSAFLAGATSSNQATLPVLMGPDLTYNGGDIDSLVAKLDTEGKPVYVGYLGGDQVDFAEGIAVNAAGEAHVTGVVQSDEQSFPVTEGPDLTFNGETDCFVVKLKAVPDDRQAVRNLVYGGYIGGENHDIGVFPIPGSTDVFVTAGHITVDGAGAAYVSGMTLSRQNSFPDGDGFGALTSPDRSFGGQWDAFIAKVEPGGKDLGWAGYAGGNGEEHGNGVGVDAAGAVYFSGQTNSPPLSLGVKVGPDLTPNGKIDALAAKVAPDGASYVYLGYLGGAGDDVGSGATVSPEGELVIAGYTDSYEDSLPVTGGPDLSYNDLQQGDGDVLVARLKADPSDPDPVANFVHCGYIGGTVYDQGFWVDLGPAGHPYVVGDSESGPDSFPDGDGTGGLPGLWPESGGSGDAFIVKLGEPGPPPTAATPPTVQPSQTPPVVEPSPSSQVPTATVPAATATTPPEPSATLHSEPSPTGRATDLPALPRIFLPWLER